VADVIDGYYDVARRQQQLDVLREAASISRERLRIVEARREVGSASDLAVRQARVDLNADSAAVLRQQTTLVTARSRLNRLLGRSGDASVRYAVASSIDVDTSLGYRPLQQAALQKSPALEQARQASQAAQAANFFPSVDLTAGYGYSQLDAESGFLQERTSTDFTYGVSLSLELFDGLTRWREAQNAEIRATNARLAVEDVRTRLTTELTSVYERYQNRLRLLDLERQNLEAVRANVDVALRQFESPTWSSGRCRSSLFRPKVDSLRHSSRPSRPRWSSCASADSCWTGCNRPSSPKAGERRRRQAGTRCVRLDSRPVDARPHAKPVFRHQGQRSSRLKPAVLCLP
jgi:outer membrane protein TolC